MGDYARVQSSACARGDPTPGEVVDRDPARLDEPPELNPHLSAPSQLDPALVLRYPIDFDEPLELHFHQSVVKIL